MNRFIKLTVALVLALSGFLVAGASVSSAQASEQRTVAHQKAPAAKKATRSVQLVFTRASRTAFRVKAQINPRGGKKATVLQYKRKASGTWKRYRVAKQNRFGAAKFGKVSKLGYYRAFTKQTANYSRSYSNVVRVYRV